jgi:hypothetical protein
MAKKQKKLKMEKKAKAPKKDGDPLKMYTLVMAFLVVLMGGLYLYIDSTRKAYREANTKLTALMRFEGETRDPDITPTTIPDLAWEIESLADTSKQAGGAQKNISRTMMDSIATNARLHQTHASGESTTKGGGGSYETRKQRFEYDRIGGKPPYVWQLLDLAWNIEHRSRGRYRVSEISWQVVDRKDDPEPPFDLIKRAKIEVSLRVPAISQ